MEGNCDQLLFLADLVVGVLVLVCIGLLNKTVVVPVLWVVVPLLVVRVLS